jgi:hypothetical protein
VKCDLQLSGFPPLFIDSVLNSKGTSHPEKEKKPLGSLSIPYMEDIFEKVRYSD